MPERESMEVDVLIVGGGPAGLGCAIQLMKEINAHNDAVANSQKEGEALEEPMIVLIEKGATVGAHGFSGGVMVPTVLEKLFPNRDDWKFDMKTPVTQDRWSFLTEGLRVPLMPPPGHSNKGNLIISLSQMTAWLGDEAENLGVNIFPGFGGVDVLYNDAGDVIGVRTGDKGIDKEGEQKGHYEPGIDLMAKVTVFAEGPRGTLTKQLIKKKELDKGKKTMVYSTGVKELWELPEGATTETGTVEHTMGYPLGSDEFGGGFIYHLEDNKVTVGFVTSLDYRNPMTDPHLNLQKFKTHPRISTMLKDAKMIGYGGKVIPEGGWDSLPELSGNGFMIVGDSAGFLNLPALKGIHLAMQSGIFAADVCLDALVNKDNSATVLSAYSKKVEDSFIGSDLKETRTFRQHFDGNFFKGLVTAGIDMMTKGKVAIGVNELERDGDALKTIEEYFKNKKAPEDNFVFDGKLTFDKLTDIYHSGTQHEEDQPPHLKVGSYDICSTRCVTEYGNPCVRFCPAGVYEMVTKEGDGVALKLNASNCIHCKTCDIKDPYENINWVLPEGGGGPSYGKL